MFRQQSITNTQPFDAHEIVGLIVRHRYYQLRNAGSKALCHGADATVMYQCSAPRQQQAERREWHVQHGGWQIRRQVFDKAGQQQTTLAELFTSADCSLKECAALAHGGTGSEGDWRGTRCKKVFESSRHFCDTPLVVQRETSQLHLWWPVRLRPGKPLGPQSDYTLR